MDNKIELDAEYEKLMKRSKISSFANLIFGVILVSTALATSRGLDLEILQLITLRDMLAPIGGTCIGIAIVNWKGSSELKFIRRMREQSS